MSRIGCMLPCLYLLIKLNLWIQTWRTFCRLDDFLGFVWWFLELNSILGFRVTWVLLKKIEENWFLCSQKIMMLTGHEFVIWCSSISALSPLMVHFLLWIVFFSDILEFYNSLVFLFFVSWKSIVFFFFSALNDGHSSGPEEEGILSAFYRTERNLRDAIKPMYALFFERLNAYPGGLKLLVVLRADLLAILA